jgi:hypothetical protein
MTYLVLFFVLVLPLVYFVLTIFGVSRFVTRCLAFVRCPIAAA